MIDKDITAFVDAALSPKAQSKAIADFAREELKRIERQHRRVLGRAPKHETIVDGRQGASEDSVRPNGTIVYEFGIIADALVWIAEQLERHSPRRTGVFAASHTLFADGVRADPKKPPAAEEYVFLSLDRPEKVRALEGDPQTGRKPHSSKAPNGVYEVVADLARRRFGNQASVHFTYHAPFGSSFRGLTGKARRQAEKDVRVPAIVVVPR
jgi:hypothetical protein